MLPLPAIPAAVRRLELLARRQLAGQLGGAWRSPLRGQGLEFSELRPYQPGDDLRHLHAAASARTGIPQVRVHHEERNRNLLLLVDLSASCGPAQRRLLEETAALLGFAAAGQRDRVGLIAFSDRIETMLPLRGGSRHIRRLLLELCSLQPAGRGTDLTPPLRAAGGLLHKPAMIVLLSDLFCPLPVDLLRRLGSRHDLLAITPATLDLQQLPDAGLVSLEDAETGRRQVVDLHGRAAEFRQSWRRHQQRQVAQLRELQIDCLQVDSEQTLLAQLRRLFARRRPR